MARNGVVYPTVTQSVASQYRDCIFYKLADVVSQDRHCIFYNLGDVVIQNPDTAL
jgi:hypothetical protein